MIMKIRGRLTLVEVRLLTIRRGLNEFNRYYRVKNVVAYSPYLFNDALFLLI